MGNTCGPSRPPQKKETRPIVILSTFVNQFFEENSYHEVLLKLPMFDENEIGHMFPDTLRKVHAPDGTEFLFAWGEGTGRCAMRPYRYRGAWVLIILVNHNFLKGNDKYFINGYIEDLTTYEALKDTRLLVVVTPPNQPDFTEPMPSNEQMKFDAEEAFQACPQSVEVMTCLETKEATMEEVMNITARWVVEMTPIRNPPSPLKSEEEHKSLDVLAKMKLMAKSLPKKVILR